MIKHSFAVAWYIFGVALMVLATITGKLIQDDLSVLGAQNYLQGGLTHVTAMFFFIFGFPMGVGFCLSGVALMGGKDKLHPLIFVVLAALSILIIMFIHKVLGVAQSPAYFGTGGITLLVLMVVSIWFWGKYRATCPNVSKNAIDLQAIGYLFFGLAAWNLCGVGGPPGFALYPEKMLVLEPKFFAVAQLKVVMAFFVLAWIFTALGFHVAAKSAHTKSV